MQAITLDNKKNLETRRNMKSEPSELDYKIIATVTEYQNKNHYLPSYREIAKAVGLKTASGVWHHVEWLVKEGYLKRQAVSPRALVLPTEIIRNSWIPIYELSILEDNILQKRTVDYFPTNDEMTDTCYGVVAPNAITEWGIKERDILFIDTVIKDKGEKILFFEQNYGLTHDMDLSVKSNRLGVLIAMFRKI